MLIQVSKIISISVILCASIMVPAQANVDNCMVGKWKPGAGQLKKQFSQLSQQQVKAVTGQVTLSFDKRGTGVYQIRNLNMLMKPPASGGPAMDINIVMNGATNFNWSAGNKKFSIKNKKINLKTSGFMNMGGQRIPIPSMPINNNKGGGVADGRYTCSGNKLIVDSNKEGGMLKIWHRM